MLGRYFTIYNYLLNVEYGPDHLLHGGGPAHVHGLAEALGGPGLAGGADEMTITTGKYLERRLHGLKADRAGGEQGGRRRMSRGTRSTSSRTTKLFLKFLVQCFFGLLIR